MSIVSINWSPSGKEIKGFGRSMLIGFGIIGAVFFFFFDHTKTAMGLWIFGVLAFAFSYLVPKLALLIYYPWMGVSFVMGSIISYLIVAFIFFILITPVAIIFKIIGRDPLSLKVEKSAGSYWIQVKRTKPYNVKTYEAQF